MSENFKKEFGKNLKEIRELKGITQELLAERVGVAEKTLSYWENGHNAVTFGKIPLLAKALEVPVYRLFVFNSVTDSNQFAELIGLMSKAERDTALKVIKLILSLK